MREEGRLIKNQTRRESCRHLFPYPPWAQTWQIVGKAPFQTAHSPRSEVTNDLLQLARTDLTPIPKH